MSLFLCLSTISLGWYCQRSVVKSRALKKKGGLPCRRCLGGFNPFAHICEWSTYILDTGFQDYMKEVMMNVNIKIIHSKHWIITKENMTLPQRIISGFSALNITYRPMTTIFNITRNRKNVWSYTQGFFLF